MAELRGGSTSGNQEIVTQNSRPYLAGATISSVDGSYLQYGPNALGGYLYVGATSSKISANVAQVISTDGNLHLDSGTGQNLYLNFYSNRPIYIFNGGFNITKDGGSISVNGNITAPAFIGSGANLTGTASGLSVSSAAYATNAGGLTGGDGAFYGLLYATTSGDLNTYNNPGITSGEYTGTTNKPSGYGNGHFFQITDAGGTNVKTQFYFDNGGESLAIRLQWGNGVLRSWRTLIHSGNIASQSVLRSDYLKSHDIGRGWDDFVPSSVSRNIRFEFKNTTGTVPPNMGLNYGGCLHISPYYGTTGSTGDPSYQLAIYKSGGANDIQTPRLAIRAGIDSSWGAWKEVITSLNIKDYVGYQSLRNFVNGTLIKTSIDYSVTEGNPFFLEIKGNSYGSLIPFDIKIQGYIYYDTIINYGGISNGTNISGLVAICYNGQLCFWFPRQAYWQGFTVRCVMSYAGNEGNLVWSITDEVQPTTYKQVAISAHQSIHSGGGQTIGGTLYASAFQISSKRSMKENISMFTGNATELLKTVEVSVYNYKDDKDKNQRIGFIADDTHEYLSTKNHDSMDVNSCIGVLIKAVQELTDEVSELRRICNRWQ